MTIRAGLLAGLISALLAACNSSGGGGGAGGGGGGIPITPGPILKCAVARIASSSSDLVPGPIARGTFGDLVIENDRLRAIIQKGGRNWYNISEFGGNIIDALSKNSSGGMLGRDNFEEFVLGTNIESAPNYQTVEVINAGGEKTDGGCEPAIVRASGLNGEGAPDDLLDFVNGSSAIRGLGLFFPTSADDIDLPSTITIQTDYTLEAGKRYVKIDTKLKNTSSTAQRIYLTEYLNGSGEVELFQHGYGFGEAFATAPCDRCNYVAYAGHEGGAGVSYGLIHNISGSSSVSVSGVTVFLYGRDILLVATTPEQTQLNSPTAGPNFTVPANGDLTITRYFALGNGTVSSIVDVRNEIHGLTTGTVEGVVTDPQGPVAGAEIAMLSSGRDGFPSGRGPNLNVVNHFRTSADGRYQGTYPAGAYSLRLNMPGRLAGTPSTASITIANGQSVTQNFTLPAAGRIQVLVKDSAGRSIPAKVQLVGNQQGPDGGEPLNGESVLGGQLVIKTGVYGDPAADALPSNISLTEFAVKDSGTGAVTVGDTGELPVEPGSYQLSVSRGPRYSEFTQDVTVPEGQLTTVTATLAEIIETPRHIFGDFHVHSINSPDSEVTNRERVATYLAEDMDFFTPSDHEMRVDFAPVVADMGVGNQIATAPSAEVTTFDYGHFNFWPVAPETNSPDDELPNEGHSKGAKIGRGATDWGGQAPLGKDFPSSGYYSLTPQQILDDAAQDPLHAGRQVVRQINHMASHFGNTGGSGLGINTGVAPPQSSAAGGTRRLNPIYTSPEFNNTNYYSDRFDTLEVWIGTDGANGQNLAFIDQNLGDWFNLLNQGRRRTGVSNSDTHERRVTSLHTRNVISVPASLLDLAQKAAFASLSSDPHTVGDSVRAGQTTMTNAPFVVVKAANSGGQTAGLEVTDQFGVNTKPLPAGNSPVELKIDVQSPQWAQYNQILVFTNGETVRHFNAQTGQPSIPPRYKVCAPVQKLDLPAGFTRTEVSVNGGTRYETSKTVTLPAASSDYWIAVMVRGTSGQSVPMWPVVPDSFVNAGELKDRSTADRGVYALAVTNPIYVDVNGNGQWDPPGVRSHMGTTVPPAPPTCPTGNMPAP